MANSEVEKSGGSRQCFLDIRKDRLLRLRGDLYHFGALPPLEGQ